jgi:urea transporter
MEIASRYAVDTPVIWRHLILCDVRQDTSKMNFIERENAATEDQAQAVAGTSSHSLFSLGDVAERALRGIGQVFGQRSATTGIIFVLAISLNSIGMGLVCTAGAIMSTLAGVLLGSEQAVVDDGVLGLNGVLTSGAVLAYTTPHLSLAGLTNPYLWGWLGLASLASTLVVTALRSLLKRHRLPLLALPFCLVTWVFLAALKQFPFIDVFLQSTSGAVTGGGVNPSSWIALLDGTLNGISSVFFQQGWIAALFILVAIAVNSRRAALLALGGSVLATCTAYVLGASGSMVSSGAYGVNGALTSVFLGLMLPLDELRGWIYPLAGALMATIALAASVSILQPLGLPVLLVPFVLVTWTLSEVTRGFPTLSFGADPDNTNPVYLLEDIRSGSTDSDEEEANAWKQLSEGATEIHGLECEEEARYGW